jgi:hypothetical protein
MKHKHWVNIPGIPDRLPQRNIVSLLKACLDVLEASDAKTTSAAFSVGGSAKLNGPT